MDLEWRCPMHLMPANAYDDQEIVAQCGCTFPVRRNVFRFLGGDNYADAFGQQWNHWAKTQLDTHTGAKISERRLRFAVSEDLYSKLNSKRVLEVGCGAGRFTEVLLRQGAFVVSADLSSAVDANAANCPPSPNHVLIQADLARLPLRAQQFDLVLALGVIQHTPSVASSISALFEQVAPGGSLVFDNYAWGIRYLFQAKSVYRQVLKRFGPELRFKASNHLYNRWAPVHKRWEHSRLGSVLVTRFSPVVYFTSEFPELSPAHREAWGRLDTFDSLTDWYKHRLTRSKLQRIARKLDARSFDIQRGSNGWLVHVGA